MIRRLWAAGALLCALLFAAPSFAQVITAPANSFIPSTGLAWGDLNGAATFVDGTHGLPVNCITGCSGGGGGGGAITAASGAFASGSVSSGAFATGSIPDLGSPGATACSTDTGSCNLNALLQRNNQRLSSLITALGSPVQAPVATTPSSASVPVTLTSAATSYLVLAANSSRKGGSCQQSTASTGTVYWNIGAAASPTAWIFTSNPGGGPSLSLPNGQPFQGAVYAYDTAAGEQVSCLEGQ